MTRTTEITFCRICESLCGLEVDVDSGRAVAIRPDQNHVATNGFACKKGLRQHAMYSSPDRLTTPMRKTDSQWHPVAWETAYAEIGAKVNEIIDKHGPNSIAMYVGTAAGFGALHPVFAQGFMTGLGSRNLFASATQDCANKFAVAERVYGFPFTQPFPDLLRTKCLIIVGANPMVSKWSFLQVPNPRKHINDIKGRGGRVIVIDPRQTETAKAAGEHHFIRPGSDLYFYQAFLAEVLAQGGVDERVVREHSEGFDALTTLAAGWSAEASAAHTGIDAGTMRQLVEAYLQADGAALYSSTGVNMGAHGSLAFWLQEAINFITGNLDRPGGTLVGRGIIDFAKFGKKHGLLVSDDRSRIGNFRKTNDAFPGGILADEILTPGEGQIKALFVTGGNPLLTMADGNKLAKAFGQLDLLVTLDILPTVTASAGHYMLPCTSPLERPDLPFIFPLMLGMQTRPYLQATDAVLEPAGQAKDEPTIYTELAEACGKPIYGSGLFHRLLRFSQRINRVVRGKTGVPQKFWLGALLRVCGEKGFNAHLGNGLLRSANSGGDFLGKRVVTESGKVQLAPPELVEKLAEAAPQQPDPNYPFQLITKRVVGTVNSFGHHFEPFLKDDFERNHVYLNPADAEALQLSEDALADVSTEQGTIRLPVRLTPDLLPGVVAIPHGWGHQKSGQNLAKRSPGVNVNILARSGPEHVDAFSGMSELTALKVAVRPTGAAEVSGSWAGV